MSAGSLLRWLFMVVAALSVISDSSVKAESPLIFISNFAAGDKGAIQAATFDLETGKLTFGERTTGVENPFFLALSPDRKFLYSIHAQQFGSPAAEEAAAFELVGKSGKLKFLNRQSTRGSASCYLHVDATGKSLLVANYTTGNIAALPIQANGALSPAASFIQHEGKSVDPARQKGPNAHSIITTPDNKYALAADLGIDKILIYQLDSAKAGLKPHATAFAKTPPGAGPRHITFHPNGKRLYAINELQNSVTVFDYSAEQGSLTERQTISTIPAEFKGVTHCADLKITPNGKYLYGTNRGHDSVAMYKIGDDGLLTLIGIEPSRGKGPQNLVITPDGKWLLCANMPGNNVATFKIDSASGKLALQGDPIETTGPSCLMLVP